jgi:hypothetical protein
MALIITDRYPATDASGVFINDVIWAQFSHELNSSTATYYNFSVNERATYEPVTGTVNLQGVSGYVDNSVIVFVPTNGLKRNTEYMVLASTGLTTESGENLDHDDTWYFKTGNTASSGNIGDAVYSLDPSGFTVSGVTGVGLVSSGVPLAIVSTYPADYDANVSRALSYIRIEFNGVLPSGLDLYEYITVTTKGVLG